jgi:hypothetical protein
MVQVKKKYETKLDGLLFLKTLHNKLNNDIFDNLINNTNPNEKIEHLEKAIYIILQLLKK